MNETDRAWMERALQMAREAAAEGEVPVGAVFVSAEGEELAADRNRREADADPTAHAEMLVLSRITGPGFPGRWRAPAGTLYVTLEPCIMCMGALLQARLERVVYAATDPKAGAAESLYRLGDDPRLNHRIEVVQGPLADEAGALLSEFFRALREKRSAID